MPYQIHDIRMTPPDAFPLYFLDANIWIYQLSPRRSLRADFLPYVQFVDSIVNLYGVGGIEPKFAWLSLSLSEVINTWLRMDMKKVGMTDFKRQYRPSSYYQTALSQLVSDLQGYEPLVELIDDEFKSLDPFGYLLPALSPQVDFNDLYFAGLMRQHNIAIVTHDGDFDFEDVPIITCNTRLLNL